MEMVTLYPESLWFPPTDQRGATRHQSCRFRSSYGPIPRLSKVKLSRYNVTASRKCELLNLREPFTCRPGKYPVEASGYVLGTILIKDWFCIGLFLALGAIEIETSVHTTLTLVVTSVVTSVVTEAWQPSRPTLTQTLTRQGWSCQRTHGQAGTEWDFNSKPSDFNDGHWTNCSSGGPNRKWWH